MKTLTPIMHGIIDRRMLVNFRVQPDVVHKLLPSPFRPKLVNGWSIAGICLIRLKSIQPRGFPVALGITSENAAHRIAVQWDEKGTTREGVFIPRRDTSSNLQSFVGGRVFPGIHHVADFKVNECNDEFQLHMQSHDKTATVTLQAHRGSQLPTTSVFKLLADASEFFARGSVGYSSTKTPGCCDGLELCTSSWQVEPLDVLSVKSSYFDDKQKFPVGTIHFDCALLMRNIKHEWRVLPKMKGTR